MKSEQLQPKSGTTEYLFVYGTLLPELTPAEMRPFMKKLRNKGTASTPGRLYDFGAYPAALFDAGAETQVRGQVFELPDDSGVLNVLDEYEGFMADDPARSLFLRIQVEVTQTDGERRQAWAYIYHREPATAVCIPHGDYLLWKLEKALELRPATWQDILLGEETSEPEA